MIDIANKVKRTVHLSALEFNSDACCWQWLIRIFFSLLSTINTCQPVKPPIWWRVQSRWWQLCRCRKTHSWTSCLCVESPWRGGSPSPKDTHTHIGRDVLVFSSAFLSLLQYEVLSGISSEWFYLDHLLCDLPGLVNIQGNLGIPHHRIKRSALAQAGGRERGGKGTHTRPRFH